MQGDENIKRLLLYSACFSNSRFWSMLIGMIAVFSFLFILTTSLIIVRVTAVMLMLTGMSYEAARFQARSAYTGTGFTTKEAESIINHPVRRRIVSALMLIGNVGFVSFISSIVLSFIGTRTTEELLVKLAILGGGLLVLFAISRSSFLDRLLRRFIKSALKKWTKLHVRDYDSLLNLSGEFEVVNVAVSMESWLANKNLGELRLSEEGILVLGIRRADGYFIGSPRGTTMVYPADTLTMYGREELLRQIGDRFAGPEGDKQHRVEVENQQMREGREVGAKPEQKGILKRIRKAINP